MSHARRLPAIFMATAAMVAVPTASVAQAGFLDGVITTVLPGVPVPPLPNVPGLTELPATPAELAPLTGLLQTLATGGAPTDLTAVTALLSQVNAQLPAGAQQLPIASLLTQLQTGGAPTALELATLGDLLQQIAATPGVPAELAALVNPIAATLGATGGLTGLPATGSGLDGLLGLVQGGALPTGDALAPVLALLTSVSKQLPVGEQTAITDLIASLGANPSAEALAPLGELLQLLAGAPGVPAPLSMTLTQLGASLGAIPKPAATTAAAPAATTKAAPVAAAAIPAAATALPAGPKAAIKGVRVDKKRTKLTVTLKCPAGKGACTSIVYALRGAKLATAAQTLSIPAGTTVSRSFKLNAASRKAAKVKGFRVTVNALGTGGLTTKKASVKKVAAAKRK